jgi:hypothetical protein
MIKVTVGSTIAAKVVPTISNTICSRLLIVSRGSYISITSSAYGRTGTGDRVLLSATNATDVPSAGYEPRRLPNTDRVVNAAAASEKEPNP